MADIKAIETRYKGHRFRSRLEARWAVFFDNLDIHWKYEPEGFILPDGSRYLPDFWLPDQRCYAEVKGDSSKLDLERIKSFLSADSKPWLIVLGDVEYCTDGQVPVHTSISLKNGKLQFRLFSFLPMGKEIRILPSFDLRSDPEKETIVNFGTVEWLVSFRDMEKAYSAARSARFEFGEQG